MLVALLGVLVGPKMLVVGSAAWAIARLVDRSMARSRVRQTQSVDEPRID